jgi:hypothetical protein
MSETENPVLLTREGPVVRLTLNRPHRRNAMSAAMGVALDAALDALEKDTSARIIIFAGAGGHFCAGLDLTEVGSQGTEAERLAAAGTGAEAPTEAPPRSSRHGDPWAEHGSPHAKSTAPTPQTPRRSYHAPITPPSRPNTPHPEPASAARPTA